MTSGWAVGIALLCSVSAIAFENSQARKYFEQARKSFEERKWEDAQAAAAELAQHPRQRLVLEGFGYR
jgi:hypothetical protein